MNATHFAWRSSETSNAGDLLMAALPEVPRPQRRNAGARVQWLFSLARYFATMVPNNRLFTWLNGAGGSSLPVPVGNGWLGSRCARRLPSMLLACYLAAGSAMGAALTPTSLWVLANSGFDQVEHTLPGANAGSAAVSYSFSDTFQGNWSGTANCTAGGENNGVLPNANALCHVNASSIDPNRPVIGTAGAAGSFGYEVRVTSRKPSPLVFNPPIFVHVTYHGQATLSGNLTFGGSPYNSTAEARVGVSHPLFGVTYVNQVANARRTQLHEEFSGTANITLSPFMATNPIAVYVSAGASVAVMGNGTGDGQAAADPGFTFDQAAFDAYALANGFPTFSLDEYYEFEYSPGYYPPEPMITGLRIEGTNIVISFTTTNAAPYVVEARDDLSSGDWSDTVSGIVGTGNIVTVTNTGAASLPSRFYRVRRPQSL